MFSILNNFKSNTTAIKKELSNTTLEKNDCKFLADVVDFLSKKEKSNSEVDKTKDFHNFWMFTAIISSWVATIVFISVLFFCGYRKIQFGNRKMTQKLDNFSGC